MLCVGYEGFFYICVSGDEGDGTSNTMTAAAAAAAAARAAARRKTDLMPTIPSPRDRDLTPGRPQSSRTMRSPGIFNYYYIP